MNEVENELMHYGVLGMRWGHRRAQTRPDHVTKSEQKQFSKNIQKASGKMAYKAAIINSVENDIKATSEFKKYRQETSDIWKKYLDAAG